MLPAPIKAQINKLRDDLWSGGVSNPMTGVEQLTNLLFIKRLDEIQTLEESKAVGLKSQGYVARVIFPAGTDGLATPGFRKDKDTGEGEDGCPYELMRWSRFKNEKPERMYEIVADHVMPFLRTLGGAESVMASHMKGARVPVCAHAKVRRKEADWPRHLRPAILVLQQVGGSKQVAAGLFERAMTARNTRGLEGST